MLSPRHTTQDGTRPFTSIKTGCAIPTQCRLQWDALVQATLDATVNSIEFIASARVRSISVDLNAVVLCRDDGRHLLDIVPARTLRDVEDEGLALIALSEMALPTIVLTAADIQRDPVFSNCRIVWSYRAHPVGIGMRLQILQILSDEGPMSLSGLLSAVRSERDPGAAVMALACADIVELDLKSIPLGPMTPVRCRE
jgi:hypothetical protein